jgi:hypothetical protein
MRLGDIPILTTDINIPLATSRDFKVRVDAKYATVDDMLPDFSLTMLNPAIR